MTLTITCPRCGGDKWSGTLGTPGGGLHCGSCGPRSAGDLPEGFDSEARAGELWHALIADVTAPSCRFPCLRDDLIDWMRDYFKRASVSAGDL